MHTRRDECFTIITDYDLHDHQFTAAHYHGNSHIDLTLPLSRHDRRTIHLGGHQCRQWGLKLLEFAETFRQSTPAPNHDFQI